MEDTLRVIQYKNPKLQDVLILVLMEDTLRVGQLIKGAELGGLNPCFTGRYSQRQKGLDICKKVNSLNPCFNGRYSQRVSNIQALRLICVLILVLMEDTLRGSRIW